MDLKKKEKKTKKKEKENKKNSPWTKRAMCHMIDNYLLTVI